MVNLHVNCLYTFVNRSGTIDNRIFDFSDNDDKYRRKNIRHYFNQFLGTDKLTKGKYDIIINYLDGTISFTKTKNKLITVGVTPNKRVAVNNWHVINRGKTPLINLEHENSFLLTELAKHDIHSAYTNLIYYLLTKLDKVKIENNCLKFYSVML